MIDTNDVNCPLRYQSFTIYFYFVFQLNAERQKRLMGVKPDEGWISFCLYKYIHGSICLTLALTIPEKKI